MPQVTVPPLFPNLSTQTTEWQILLLGAPTAPSFGGVFSFPSWAEGEFLFCIVPPVDGAQGPPPSNPPSPSQATGILTPGQGAAGLDLAYVPNQLIYYAGTVAAQPAMYYLQTDCATPGLIYFGGDLSTGAQSDPPATNATSSWSAISLLKWIGATLASSLVALLSSVSRGTTSFTYSGSDVTGLTNPLNLWTPVATTAFSLKYDTATQTGVVIPGIVGGYWSFPVGGVTKVYSASNGSTGLPIGAVIFQ